jgi:hypothetical protein
MSSSNPLSGLGGNSDRKSIRDVLGLDGLDPAPNRVLTREEFAACVRTINTQIER